MTRSIFEECVMTIEGFLQSTHDSKVNVQKDVVCKGVCRDGCWRNCRYVSKEYSKS